ncbi:unnamed protein product, partial [Cyprideis torosa]
MMTGTPKYCAPELLDKGLRYGTPVDVYSLSLILFELFTGEDPFKGCTSVMQVLAAIMRDERPQIPNDFPEALKPILEKGWSKDPIQRPPLTLFRDALQKVSDDLEKELAEKTAAKLRSLTLGTPSPESNLGASEANRPSPAHSMSFAGAAAASVEEEVEGIPCEFCGTLLNLDELLNHERRCFNDQVEELNRWEVLRGRRPRLEISAPDSPAASMPSASRLSLRPFSRQ